MVEALPCARRPPAEPEPDVAMSGASKLALESSLCGRWLAETEAGGWPKPRPACAHLTSSARSWSCLWALSYPRGMKRQPRHDKKPKRPLTPDELQSIAGGPDDGGQNPPPPGGGG